MADVAVLLITDGRPCLRDTLASAEEFLFPYCDGPTVLVSDVGHKKGLSGSVREGWETVHGIVDAEWGTPDFVFHLEDDWVFREPVPIAEMVDLLCREKLTQVALKRDAVNPHELAVGGFMEANPDNYTQRDGWVQSRFGFTLNPCLYATYMVGFNPWPLGGGEREFTDSLPAKSVFGIYGNLTDPPRCFHIGHQRAEGWKL
jgi:hypothetical protein